MWVGNIVQYPPERRHIASLSPTAFPHLDRSVSGGVDFPRPQEPTCAVAQMTIENANFELPRIVTENNDRWFGEEKLKEIIENRMDARLVHQWDNVLDFGLSLELSVEELVVSTKEVRSDWKVDADRGLPRQYHDGRRYSRTLARHPLSPPTRTTHRLHDIKAVVPHYIHKVARGSEVNPHPLPLSPLQRSFIFTKCVLFLDL